jgi:uncharacterized membrane protein
MNALFEVSLLQLQRLLWVPITSIFASSILDRLTTFLGLSAGFVESNQAQAWVLAHFPWFFYSSALIIPAVISAMIILGIRFLEALNFRMHRRFLAFFFLGLSLYSWTPVVNNLILLRGAV